MLSIFYSEGLGEAYDGDIAFASALETFGGGHNDPISVAFGGMSKLYAAATLLFQVLSTNYSFHSLIHWHILLWCNYVHFNYLHLCRPN